MHQVLKDYLSQRLNLSDEEWAFVLKHFKPKKTKRNEILLDKGQIAKHLYFVTKGSLRVFLINDEGQESTRFLIFEGRFGTAFPSFTLQQPSVASIQSIEASEILMISRPDYGMLMDAVPGWERMTRLDLEKDYIASIIRIESLISMDARQRYNILLANNPKLIQRLPAKIVADYLGISQETLSRLKGKESGKSGKSEKSES